MLTKSRVFCLASAKGGSGKTVLAASLATFLSSLNKRVLLIDVDASTNGLSLFYLRDIVAAFEAQDGVRKGLFETWWQEPATRPDVVELSDYLHMLPATYRFRNTESVPIGQYKHSLGLALEYLRNEYDYIFLDAQAGSDAFAEVAMDPGISDRVVIVSEYDPMSAAGVERLKALFRDNLDYQRTWILLNKMLPEFVKSFRDFLEIARYLSPVPWNAEVVRAYSRRSLALDLNEGNEYTTAIVQTLRTMLDDDDRSELEAWLARREGAVKEPLRTQLKEIEARLNAYRAEQAMLEKLQLRRRLLVSSTILFAFMASIAITLAFTRNAAVVLAVNAALVAMLASAVPLIFSSSRVPDSRESEIYSMERQANRLRALVELDSEGNKQFYS